MKHIFIGGTGRSGTTILLHVLSFHPQLYTLPMEMKFITQADGLCSFIDHMTRNFTITDGALALKRFRHLMYEVITHRGDNPYADLTDEPYARLEFLPQDLFPGYFESLDRFFETVDDRPYRQDTLINYARELVDGLFTTNAIARNAIGWVEKTPSNFARIECLFKLYPDALFVNCVRDPRGVVHSFMRRDWTRDGLENAAQYFAAYYEHLEEKRSFGLARPSQYYELRLESLVVDPVGEISELLQFLGVEPFSDERNQFLLTTLRQGSMRWVNEFQKYCDAWELAFSDDERQIATDILGNAIKQWGYR